MSLRVIHIFWNSNPRRRNMESVVFSLFLIFIKETHSVRYGIANNLQPYMWVTFCPVLLFMGYLTYIFLVHRFFRGDLLYYFSSLLRCFYNLTVPFEVWEKYRFTCTWITLCQRLNQRQKTKTPKFFVVSENSSWMTDIFCRCWKIHFTVVRSHHGLYWLPCLVSL